MPGHDRLPNIRIVDPDPDAVIGTIELTPILAADGTVADRLVTRATGTGITLLFGDLASLRSRRVGELDPTRAQFVHQLLSLSDSTPSATVELQLAERRMLMHLHSTDQTVTIVFARIDNAAPAITGTVHERITRLRTMLAQFSDGIAMYEPIRDHDGTITDFACLEMSDTDTVLPADEQIGRTLLDLFPETLHNGTFAGYIHAITSGEPWTPDPVLYERDNQRYAYRITANAIDGNLIVSWHDTLIDTEPTDTAPTGEALTLRQQQILQAIADGRATTDIATDLFLSPFTIRNEVRRILAKLGVRTRAEAVSRAHANNLITRPPLPS